MLLVQDIIDLREFGSAPVEDRCPWDPWDDLWCSTMVKHGGIIPVTEVSFQSQRLVSFLEAPFTIWPRLESCDVQDWMTVSWVRLGPSYGQLPNEVRQLNELARESDRFRRARDEMVVDVACFLQWHKGRLTASFFTHQKYTLEYCIL